MALTPVEFLNFFAYYKGEPHQEDAVLLLHGQLMAHAPDLLEDDAAWVLQYRTRADAENSWDGIVAAAKDAGSRYPELTAAQWALESAWGKHTSGTNNFFGLKGSGTSTTTQECINGEWVTITADFIDFPSIRSCVTYLVDRWYKDYKQWKGVNNAADRNGAAQMLVSEGYATDPDYAAKLIRLMDEHAPAAPAPTRDPLKTPYFSQNDNASGTGYRECFSSSCAMVAAFYGKVKTDDEYNAIRTKYGDTTSSEAQLRALRSLGLQANFRTNGSPARLKELLAQGVPVPCGWLHKGHVSSPSGGGHWSVVIGVDGDRWVVNDPNGQADLVNGGYTPDANGHGERYSFKNFNRRWEVNGPGTGWYMVVTD